MKIREIINQNPVIKRFPFLKEMFKFGVVGVSNIVVDTSVYTLLTRVFHLYFMLAAVGAFIIAVTWSFYFNRRWTFRSNGKKVKTQYFKFFLVNGLVVFLNLLFFYLAVEFVHIYDLIAKPGVGVVIGFINFTLNKFWTFSKEKLEV